MLTGLVRRRLDPDKLRLVFRDENSGRDQAMHSIPGNVPQQGVHWTSALLVQRFLRMPGLQSKRCESFFLERRGSLKASRSGDRDSRALVNRPARICSIASLHCLGLDSQLKQTRVFQMAGRSVTKRNGMRALSNRNWIRHRGIEHETRHATESTTD